MHICKFCAVLAASACLSSIALSDTLTFIAQPGLGGAIDYNWFNSANWFASDAGGNLSPAGRVPLANETAVIIGSVDAGPGGVRVQTLLATNNAAITNGTFAVENLQMRAGSSFNNSTVNLLVSMTVGGTNCMLNTTTLTVFGTATAVLAPIAPSTVATVTLSEGSLFQDQGVVSLTDGSQVIGGGGLQSRFLVSPGAALISTNQTFFSGPATNHLVLDNSGLIRVDGGTLRFGDGLDWRSTGGAGEFQAASTNSLLLFAAPFHADAGVTDSFTGPGTNRWLTGASLDGIAQVMGNLEVLETVSGAGMVRVLGNAAPSGLLTWINGTFAGPQINIDAGGNMVFDGGPGTARQLSGCALNNSGSCILAKGDLSFSQAAVISNLIGATFDFQAAGSVTLSETNGGGFIDNTGTIRNSGSGIIQFGAVTQPGPDLNNAGLLDVVSGQVNLLGGASSGEFRTAAGAVLWFWGGTHTFNTGSSFTGSGSVRLLRGVASARWLMNAAIIVARLEVGSSGTIDGSGNSSGQPIHFGALVMDNDGTLSRGQFEAQSCQMLDQSTLTNCTMSILGTIAVNGTNCSLNNSTLNIHQGAVATLESLGSPMPATLYLGQGSLLQNAGLISLTDGSQLIGTSPPQNQLDISPGATLSATNTTSIDGSATNHLLIDNSGLIRVDGGTLRFGDGIDWKSSVSIGEFRASAPSALILFTGPFHSDSGITDLFTGPGTNRWLAGANLGGTAQVGSMDPITQTSVPGNLELLNSVSGTGAFQVVGSPSEEGLLTWINGTISVPQVSIGIGGNLLIVDGTAANHHLSGCRISNSGHCVWSSQLGVTGGNGAIFDNAGGGVLDLRTDTVLSFDNVPPMTALNNAGTFLKSAGNGITSLAADFKNSGALEIQAGTVDFQGFWVQSAGSAQVDGGATLGARNLSILGGRLSGTGAVNGAVTNAGVVSPGTSPGTLTIAAGKDYLQTPIGTLKVEIGGHAAGQYDQLAVGGQATIGGRLQVSLINGFAPQPGDTFQIMTCTAETGAFSSIDPTGITGTYWFPRYDGTNVTIILANGFVLSPPEILGGSLSFSFATTPGLTYQVQATDNFTPPNWETIKTIPGDGTIQTITDPATKTHRFYRVAFQ